MYLGYEKNMEERLQYFLEDVEQKVNLDDTTKVLSRLAVMIGSQGIDLFKQYLPYAYTKVSGLQIQEVVYQATAYLGMSRVYPFVQCLGQHVDSSTTTIENRLEVGSAKQCELFGPHMKDFYKGGQVNQWLAENCFGDYYTREGLDNKQREWCTFCYLYAQGGVEPQLKSHIAANLGLGTSKEFLLDIVKYNIPMIGYPRTLNAIRCVEEA
ncbi:MAG: carboxymuconolactone decarboxylase family protein [Firmicutes bacterium]|nr:carboxymuconolactone decarboxylase family protein [Bacillota bacterium]